MTAQAENNKKLLVYIAVIFSFVILSLIGFGYSETSGTCFLCHKIEPEYNSWRRKGHLGLNCLSCHLPVSGAISVVYGESSLFQMAYFHIKKDTKRLLEIKERPRSFKEVYFYIKTNGKTLAENRSINVEICLDCHKLKNKKVEFIKGRVINHFSHEAAMISCFDCHRGLVHYKIKGLMEETKKIKKISGVKVNISMAYNCLRCHDSMSQYKSPNGKIPPKNCDNCHLESSYLPLGHGGDWRSTHQVEARKNLRYCFECHGKASEFAHSDVQVFCARCHASGEVTEWQKQAGVAP